MSIKQNIPNALTAFRIVVIPVICLLVLIPYVETALAAFVLFTLAAVSDFFDGYLARRWQAGSVMGRVFDPIADKLLVGALLLCLVANGTIVGFNLIPAAAIILRELLISGLREYLGPLGIMLPVSKLAKWKTTAQLVALALLLLAIVPHMWVPALIMLWIAAALSVWTAAEYIGATWSRLSKS